MSSLTPSSLSFGHHNYQTSDLPIEASEESPVTVNIHRTNAYRSSLGRRLQFVHEHIQNPPSSPHDEDYEQKGDLKKRLAPDHAGMPAKKTMHFQSPNKSSTSAGMTTEPAEPSLPAWSASISFWKSEVSSSHAEPPPTPNKKKSSSRFSSPPPVSTFKTAFKNAQNGTFKVRGHATQLEAFGRGSYMDVYTPTASMPLVEGKSNDQLVIIVFNQRIANTGATFSERLMRTAFSQYVMAQKAQIPVAMIHNVDSALKDGFYIQEKIAHQVDVLNPSHVDQSRELFSKFLKNKDQGLVCDFMPENLRVASSGIVTVIDFPEEVNEFDTWDIFCKKGMEKWCELFKEATKADSEVALQFLKDFTKGFETYGYMPQWNEEIIKTLYSSINPFCMSTS